MKPMLIKLPDTSDCSFQALALGQSHLDLPWHYHREYEIVLVTKSTGRKRVGYSTSDFAGGELCLFGSNLPHTHNLSYECRGDSTDLVAEATVIHFDPGFFGARFSTIPEMENINKLLNRSALGLQFMGETRDRVESQLKLLIKAQGISKVSLLLNILEEMANSTSFNVLSNQTLVGNNSKVSDRMNKVYDYVHNHFREKITLGEVARLVNMSNSAFCRYFYMKTEKTFTQFVNETRIGHACKLLIGHGRTVYEVAYESGFNNISHFNRQFKMIKGSTPIIYLKELAR